MQKQKIQKQKKSGLRIATRVISIIEIVLVSLMIIAGIVLLAVGYTDPTRQSITSNWRYLVITGWVLFGVGMGLLALAILALVFANKSRSFGGCLALGIVTGVLTSIFNPTACLLILIATIDCKKQKQIATK